MVDVCYVVFICLYVCDYTISASTVELFEELFGACYFHGFDLIPVGKSHPLYISATSQRRYYVVRTSLSCRRDVVGRRLHSLFYTAYGVFSQPE